MSVYRTVLVAELATRTRRMAQRQSDASDATLETVRLQEGYQREEQFLPDVTHVRLREPASANDPAEIAPPGLLQSCDNGALLIQ